MSIITSPAVQFGLDPQYPALCLIKGVLKFRPASIHQRKSRHSSLLTTGLLAPFPMHTPFACPEYYGASVPPAAINRQRTCPPPGPAARTGRATTGGSHVHCVPIGQLGTQLYSGSLASGYAADLHRGLPAGYPTRLRS